MKGLWYHSISATLKWDLLLRCIVKAFKWTNLLLSFRSASLNDRCKSRYLNSEVCNDSKHTGRSRGDWLISVFQAVICSSSVFGMTHHDSGDFSHWHITSFSCTCNLDWNQTRSALRAQTSTEDQTPAEAEAWYNITWQITIWPERGPLTVHFTTIVTVYSEKQHTVISLS